MRARCGVRMAEATGRVATWIGHDAVAAAELAVVGGVVRGAVAAAGVQLPVGAERDRADRVTRELPAPVFDQHLLVGDGAADARKRQLRDAPAGDAAVHLRVGARVVRAVAGPPSGRRARVAEHVVVRVLDIEIRTRRPEVGVEREPEQALVDEVVDLGAQVGDEVRGRIADAVVAVDASRLLGDEHLAVGRELDRRRLVPAGEDSGVLKQRGQRPGRPCAHHRQHRCHAERGRECHDERDRPIQCSQWHGVHLPRAERTETNPPHRIAPALLRPRSWRSRYASRQGCGITRRRSQTDHADSVPAQMGVFMSVVISAALNARL